MPRRTFREIISEVDDTRANVFDEERKFGWLCELISQFQAEEWNYDILPDYVYINDIDNNVPSPREYDLTRCYAAWLRFKVNTAQEDYDLAEQDKVEYDQIRSEYHSWRIRRHGPHGERRNRERYEARRSAAQ